MTNRRRDFIRNALMALSISLLPKILLPSNGDLEKETVEAEVAEISVNHKEIMLEYDKHSGITYFAVGITLKEYKKAIKKSELESIKKQTENVRNFFKSLENG